jgi:Fe2+ transport system protein B
MLAALGALLLLGIMAARTLTDERFRLATLVVLGFFAVRIVIAHRFKARKAAEQEEQQREQG